MSMSVGEFRFPIVDKTEERVDRGDLDVLYEERRSNGANGCRN